MKNTDQGILSYKLHELHASLGPMGINELLLGMKAHSKGQYVSAARCFRKILPDILCNAVLLGIWEIMCIIINSLVFVDDFDSALKIIDAGIQQNNASQQEYLKKQGIILFRLEAYQEALAALAAALTITPKDAQAMENMADTLIRLERYEDALICLEEMFDKEPSEFILQKILAAVFERVGTCDGCGAISNKTCCTNMSLTDEGETVSTPTSYRAFLLKDRRNKNWVKKGETEQGEWIFTCKYLGRKAHCTNYDARPDVCRRFPATPLDIQSFPGCSYHFTRRSKIIIHSEKIQNVIQPFLKSL